MLNWLSTCFIVSKATPTVIKIEIPLNPRGISQIADAIDGRTATDAKNTEPGKVIPVSYTHQTLPTIYSV